MNFFHKVVFDIVLVDPTNRFVGTSQRKSVGHGKIIVAFAVGARTISVTTDRYVLTDSHDSVVNQKVFAA